MDDDISIEDLGGVNLTNLNVISNFDFLESSINIFSYLAFAKKNNLKKVSLISKNSLSWVADFYRCCYKNDLKPIIGFKINFFFKNDKTVYKICLFPFNENGYTNLLKIFSLTVSRNGRAAIFLSDFLAFEKLFFSCFLDNLIVLEINKHLFNKIINKNYWFLNKLIYFCHKQQNHNFYIGVRENISREEQINLLTFFIDIKFIAFNEVNFLYENEFSFYKLLKKIKQNLDYGYKSDSFLEKQKKINNKFFWLKEEYMKFFYIQKLVSSLHDFIDKVNLKLSCFQKKHSLRIPSFETFQVIKDQTKEKFLRKLVFSIFIQKWNSKKLFIKCKDDYLFRLEKELKVIEKKNFIDYFLIIWDLVNFCKKNNYFFGAGRGSVAGSLLAYLLGITKVDPLKYDLIFERFLNLERKNFPDIDFDVQDNKRDLIIKYLFKKYGYEKTSLISVHQNFTFKIIFKEVGKILSIPEKEINKLLLIKNIDIKIKSFQFGTFNDKYKKLFLLVTKIIGFPRRFTIHPSGIFISDTNLKEIIPVRKVSSNNFFISEFSSKEAERHGLLKFDILGLKSLKIFQEIIYMLEKEREKKIALDKINLDDSLTFQLLSEGKTAGISHLETEQITNLLILIKPKTLIQLANVIALYRPGTIHNIRSFIKRNKSSQQIIYLHPLLKEILKDTNGIILYQEQFIILLSKLLNISIAKADLIREKLTQKKSQDLQFLKLWKDFFFKNLIFQNDEILKKKLWNLINISGYTFNKSHAVSYSLNIYYLAFFKANYPLYFFIVSLNNNLDNYEKLFSLWNEFNTYKSFCFAKPDINNIKKNFYFCRETNKITIFSSFVLIKFKKVNHFFLKNIIEERKKNGKFENFFKFVARTFCFNIDNEMISELIQANLFCCFNFSKEILIKNIEKAFLYAKLINVFDKTKQLLVPNYELLKEPKLE